jgi:hypothetical protein
MLLVLSACSAPEDSHANASPRPSASDTRPAPSTASPTTGERAELSCGDSHVYETRPADWVVKNSGISSIPWVMARPEDAAALIWSFPVGRVWESGDGDKVMWVVRSDAEFALRITARPLDSNQPELSIPTNRASPGLMYTSKVGLPTPGCCHFSLSWGPHRAQLELQAKPPRILSGLPERAANGIDSVGHGAEALGVLAPRLAKPPTQVNVGRREARPTAPGRDTMLS